MIATKYPNPGPALCGCHLCLEPLTEDEETLHGICNGCADEIATEADRLATLEADHDSKRRHNPDGARAYTI